jgi:hypothetical protein
MIIDNLLHREPQRTANDEEILIVELRLFSLAFCLTRLFT